MRAHTLSKARLLVAVATVLVAGLVTAAVHPTVSALNTCETNKNCPQKLNLTKVFSPHDPVATVDFKVTNNNNGYEQTATGVHDGGSASFWMGPVKHIISESGSSLSGYTASMSCTGAKAVQTGNFSWTYTQRSGVDVDCTITNSPKVVPTQVLACGANSVQIPSTVVWGANGTTSLLAQLTVPASLQGKVVTANAQTTNNASVHPDTDLIVASNSTSFSLDDIEGSTNKVTTGSGQLTLGSTIDVSVEFGPDGVFSGGGTLDLTVVCQGGRGGGSSTPTTTPQVTSKPTKVNAGAGGATQANLAAYAGMIASLAVLLAGLRRANKREL